MFEFSKGDLVSAVVRDGKLYEEDGTTPMTDVVFVNGLLMRETSIESAQRALKMARATV